MAIRGIEPVTLGDPGRLPGWPVISIGDAFIDEKAGVATLVVTLDRPAQAPFGRQALVTVDWTTVAGPAAVTNATAGSDFSARSGTLSFAPGQTTQTIQIPVVDDGTLEGGELFTVRLSSPTGGRLGKAEGTVWIAPSDAAALPTGARPVVHAHAPAANEADGFVDLLLSLSAPSTQAVSVALDVDSRYISGDQTVTFAPGETAKTARISIAEYLNDGLRGTEFFYVQLRNAVNADIGTPAIGVRNFFADVQPSATSVFPDPTVSVRDAVVDEASGVALIEVVLGTAAPALVSMDWSVSALNAGAADLGLRSGTLQFVPGQRVATLAVPIVDDSLAEGDEFFGITIGNISGAVAGRTSAIGRIVANDGPLAALPLLHAEDTHSGEGRQWVDVAVSLSAPSAQAVSVNWRPEALGGIPIFVAGGGGTLVFAPGETTRVLRIGLDGFQSTGSFYVHLESPQNALIGHSRALVTVDQYAALAPIGATVYGSDVVVDEASGTASFVFRLSQPLTVATGFSWATQHLGTDDSDFTPGSGRVQFGPGQSVASVVVPIHDDALAEGDERFTLVLSDADGLTLHAAPIARIGASGAATAASPQVFIESARVDGAGFVEAVVRLSTPSTQVVSVSYQDSLGGTVWDQLFGYGESGTLNFAPGETLKTVRYPVFALASGALDNFDLRLHTAANATIGVSTHAVTPGIALEVAQELTVRVDDVFVDESAGIVTFVVRLHGAFGTATVDYATSDGSATAGSDYVAVYGTLHFSSEQLAQVQVPLLDDAAAEGAERFSLTLSHLMASRPGTIVQASASAWIAASDNAAPAVPVLSVAPVLANESAGVAELVLRLNHASDQPAHVSFASVAGSTAPADHATHAGTVVFAPGETLKVLRLALAGDAEAEATEAFGVRFSAPENLLLANDGVFVGIAANDSTGYVNPASRPWPIVRVLPAAVDEGAGWARLVVTLDRASPFGVSVDWSTQPGGAGGSDFAEAGGTLGFAAGETVRTVLVPLIDDVLAEGDEAFTVVLTSAVGAALGQASAEVRIVANDQAAVALPQLIVEPATVSEQQGYADVVVRLTAPGSGVVSVNYADVAGGPGEAQAADYGAGISGTLRFAPGVTAQTLRFAITDDTVAESPERFTVRLSAPVNATLGQAEALVTITDRGPMVSHDHSLSSAGPVIGAVDVVYTLSFPEPVNGLTVDDFTVTNGSIAGPGALVSVAAPPGTSAWQLTVGPVPGLQAAQQVLVLRAGAVTNAANIDNQMAAFGGPLLDTRAPQVAGISPALGATGVRTDADIRIRFDEPVHRGPGAVELWRGSTLVETFAGVPGDPMGWWPPLETLVLDPAAPLLPDTEYTLVVAAGAARDQHPLQPNAAVTGHYFRTGPVEAGGSVRIASAPITGGRLTVENTISPALGPFSYAWLRDGQPASAPDAPHYDTYPHDDGARFSVRVSWRDPNGQVVSVTSDATPPLAWRQLNGGTGNERLMGTDSADSINGGAGDDLVFGGPGNDWLVGGDGYDILDHRGPGRVYVDLGRGYAVADVSENFVGFEVVFGSSAADTLVGVTQSAPHLRGETLRGGAGDDTIDGAEGVDSAEFTGPRAGYIALRNPATGVITVVDTDPSNGDDGVDRLTNIERLQFADVMVAFGSRAEEIARVAMALWTPGIITSTGLFGRAYSYYDPGSYSFDTMVGAALTFWTHVDENGVAERLSFSSGGVLSQAELIAAFTAAGGGNAGREAMVRAAANHPSMTAILVQKAVHTDGVVAINEFDGFGTLFGLWPG